MTQSKRPASITFIAFLVWIGGLLNVILGLLLVFGEDFRQPNLTPFAVATALVGIVTVLVALGLLHANPMARIIVTVLLILSLVSASSHLLLDANVFLADVVSIAISVVALLLLWSRKANQYF